ncbi:MAG: hypothetical protein HYS05_14065 [Acidobacteria bacterium]|nr:hypothetical protein [Acidobacteriota bacterium]
MMGMLSLGVASGAAEEARLNAADIVIALPSTGGCEVEMRLEVETSTALAIDHRLRLDEGARLETFAVSGAQAGSTRTIGRTVSLPLSFAIPGRHPYTLRYRVIETEDSADRCPIWLPAAPTEGIRRAVRLLVTLPSDVRRLPGGFPAFEWATPAGGVVALNHLPAFVRVPRTAAGTPVSWRETVDVGRLLDAAAIFCIAASTTIWVARRRRAS